MPSADRYPSGLAALHSGPILFLRADLSGVAHDIGTERLICEQGFKPAHDRLQSAGFRVATEATGSFALVLVNATPSRPETLANLARAWGMLIPGGTLLLNADRQEGADSLLKALRSALGEAESESRAHGRLISLKKTATPAPDWALHFSPNDGGFLAQPGMFSADGVDPGSAMLAEAFNGALKGRVADLGAGWGYLSAKALETCPGITEMHLFEAEHVALQAARLNLTDPRTSFHWADVTALGPAEGGFDVVIMNPPFHAGKSVDPALGPAFIRAAASVLKPSGRAWIVANRQLPYEAALTRHFRQSEKIAERGGFKVYRCDRPTARPR